MINSLLQVATGKDCVLYTTACSDTVPQLSMFKGVCKPLFLFILDGWLLLSVITSFVIIFNIRCPSSISPWGGSIIAALVTRARRDIGVAMSFLTSRVKRPNEDAWGKLKQVL